MPGRPHETHSRIFGLRQQSNHDGDIPLLASLNQFLDQVPWTYVVIACLTLGLAPFVPEPHVWEKLKMLSAGALVRPIDIFDLLLHASPFLFALLKLAMTLVPAK